MRLPLPLTKLAALGAVGAAGGLGLLFLLFLWLAIPQPATAGIDRTHGSVLGISLGLVFLALIALHFAMAHQLWHAPTPPPIASKAIRKGSPRR